MSWEKVDDDISSGPFGLLKWVVIISLFVTIIGGGLKVIGVATDAAIFENSYQKQQADKSRVDTLRASIAEIDMMIQQYPDRRNELQQQKRVLNVQLRAALSK